MTLSDRIQQLIIQNNTSQSELEKILGFGKGTISKWKGSTAPSADKLQKIAEHFGVTIDYLMNGRMGLTTCKDCGYSYNADFSEDVKKHERVHSAWEEAVEKFGELLCYYPEREKIKADSRNISHNTSFPLDDRCNAQIRVLKCLFSRSVESSNFNLNHVSFEEYIAMMLGNSRYRKNLEDDLYNALVERYGTLPGISSGSIYHIPHEELNTLAAHFDGDEYTDEELEEIRQFAEFVKNKRK